MKKRVYKKYHNKFSIGRNTRISVSYNLKTVYVEDAIVDVPNGWELIKYGSKIQKNDMVLMVERFESSNPLVIDKYTWEKASGGQIGMSTRNDYPAIREIKSECSVY